MKLVYATRDAGEDRAGGAHCCRRGIRLASLEWVRPGCMDPRSVDPSVLTFFLLSCIAIVTALNPKRRSILQPFALRRSLFPLPPRKNQKINFSVPKSLRESRSNQGSSGGKPSSKSGNQRRGSSGGDRQNRDHGERREKPPKVPGGDPTRQGKAARSGARGRSLARAHVA